MCPRRNGLAKGMVIAVALIVLPTREQDVVPPRQRRMQEARDRKQWLAQARWLQELWWVAFGGPIWKASVEEADGWEIVDWIGRKTPFRVEPDGWEIVDGWQRLTQQISKAKTNSELSLMGRGANGTTTAKAKLLPKAESDDESTQRLEEGPAPGSQPNSQPAQTIPIHHSQPLAAAKT